ncbi:YtxH domain-containing protein [Fulvivirga sediminis]|uniref:YtxH domain-containing protein n=1 Tax=Fulvivirga sediminis TaxID=2803949 RepID=A0A937F5R5_9BACT|nr:YtxH domain-containing protein [Fulvivirga sediminis]MBL3655462.1 YtxH domain-containing protein [Fulvivirga sediminis]
MNNTNIKIIAGFAAGAIAGALTGLLLAPESGDRTRKKIGKESDKLRESLSKSIAESFDAAKTKYSSLLDEYVAEGKKQLDKAKENVKLN